MSGSIYGFAATSDSRTAFLNCYYLAGTNAAAQTGCTPYTDAKDIIDNLGSANWQPDTNGNPVLKFGSTEPSVSVTASPTSLQMVNSGSQPTSMLTVKAENMDTTGATVEWSVEPEGIVELNDTGNEFQKIAAAVAPGTATIKATVKAQNGNEIESNTASIVVRPCFTTVEIKPVAPSVTVAAGQTVQAVVNVFHNTGSYAPAGDARLSYKWYWYHDVCEIRIRSRARPEEPARFRRSSTIRPVRSICMLKYTTMDVLRRMPRERPCLDMRRSCPATTLFWRSIRPR